MKVLYFSTVNWNWIKQRPHFICEGLSEKGIDIEYISLTPFLKQKKQRKIKINEHLTINDRYVMPLASKNSIIEYINIKYIEQIINKEYDVIIITHPLHYHYLRKTLRYNPKVIYECMDNMPYFYKGLYQKKIKRLEKEICKKVDLIITSSYYLKNNIINQYNIEINKVFVISNAVDKNIVSNNISKFKLKKNNLVYIGTIGEWVDIHLLINYAIKHQEDNIYIIGPSDIKMPNKIPNNIYLMGVMQHEYIKDIIKQSEILVIPFKINELIKGVDPVKIYEYKAFNKIVVATEWEELVRHNNKENIFFYRGFIEFENIIRILRNKKNYFNYSIDTEYIKNNCWDKRVEEYLEKIIYNI